MELPLNTIAAVRAVLENLNTGSPVKMCFIKKLRDPFLCRSSAHTPPICSYQKCVKFCLTLTEDEESAATRDVSRHFEDTSYGYKDFSRHGMHVPTFRVQVKGWGLCQELREQPVHCARYQTWKGLCSHCPVSEA